MRNTKRSSVEPWIENVGEAGCLEPAFKQNTNDDDIKAVLININDSHYQTINDFGIFALESI